MGASASVIQEYYKAVDYWADIAGKKDWKLAIWIVGRNDVDLVDKFLEIERSPVGQFDDIFFRFDTPYRGDDDEYAAQLWQEYAGWFDEQAEEKDDMLKALRHDGLLRTEYRPDTSAEPTAANLWKEMLRFKECISRLENAFFCIYFPPEQSGEFPRTEWFGQVLKEGVPQGIRLTTIDLKKDRNVALDESPEVVHIRLLDIAGELKDANIRISALFIASEACYAIREYKSSMKYSDKTIREAEKAMKDGEAAGYSYWKIAVSMKAAILTAEKKREEAVALYEGIAGKAVERKDPYYVMEGYRMCGFLRYEEGKLEQAFEYFLLALAGGSYLSEDIRRSSTFTYAAHLALHTGRQVRAPIDIEVLERQLHEWLGEDWKELVENPSMRQAEARRKGGIFN